MRHMAGSNLFECEVCLSFRKHVYLSAVYITKLHKNAHGQTCEHGYPGFTTAFTSQSLHIWMRKHHQRNSIVYPWFGVQVMSSLWGFLVVGLQFRFPRQGKIQVEIWTISLGGSFKYFFNFHPEPWENDPI